MDGLNPLLDECPFVKAALQSSKVSPRLHFVVYGDAVIGTLLTFAQMVAAGWFSKRQPVAIVQNGKYLM